MALFDVEPDPRDRVQLLLELVRQDAQPLGPDSIVKTLEPIVRANPEDLHTAIALGLALIRNSRIEEGLAILLDAVEHARRCGCLGRLLLGLDEAVSSTSWPMRSQASGRPRGRPAVRSVSGRGRPGASGLAGGRRRLSPGLAGRPVRLPGPLSAQPRAQGRRAGSEEAEAFDLKVRAANEAREQILPLYEEANADKTLGIAPHPELYHRLADLRERMGRHDEALAWHRLVLRDQPDDPASRAAVARLRATIDEQPASRR